MSKNKISFIFITLTLLLTGFLIAGNTSTTSTPTPTSYTLADIYNLVINNTPATPGVSLDPIEDTDTSTMHSVSDIYVALANLINPASTTATYLGVTPNVTRDLVTPITKEFIPTSISGSVTGFTLADIYDLVENNNRITTPGHTFAPASTPAGTMYSLTDIYEKLAGIPDPFILPETIATGTVYLGVVGKYEEPIICDSPLIDDRDSKSYTTVLIGYQCWMQQNLNVGTMVTGTTTMTNDVNIEKYCYNNLESNCTTYGGLYQWDEAMQYVTTPGTQGICPTDWHIPTHDEFTTLERSICSSLGNTDCETRFPYDTTTRGFLGTNEGTEMKLNSGPWKGLLSGYRDTMGSFVYIGARTTFWPSTEINISISRIRMLFSNYTTVYRDTGTKTQGFTVRCLKD